MGCEESTPKEYGGSVLTKMPRNALCHKWKNCTKVSKKVDFGICKRGVRFGDGAKGLIKSFGHAGLSGAASGI